MLPYFEQPTLHFGPVTLHAFGICVAIAMLWGTMAAERRFRRQGLDVRVGNRMGFWVLLCGVIGAHLFSVVFYFPEKLRSDPWILLRLWEDISSFGAMLGGITGALLFLFVARAQSTLERRWDYFGVVAQVFPMSLGIGRIGCAFAHDHPGTTTRFPLAISLRTEAAVNFITNTYADANRSLELAPAGALAPTGFHDLGWYELLFIALVIVPLFHLWQRRDRPGGFYLIAFPLLYLPVRFGFDFLRVIDVRYAGLTPAQWVAIVTVPLLCALVFFKRELLGSTPRNA